MSVNEFLSRVAGYSEAEKAAYKRLVEASRDPDEATELSYEQWQADMSMAAAMGLLK